MPVRDKRRVDPERDRLVDQRHIAENELGEIEAQISAVAVAATEGDGSAFKKYARLDKEATRLRAQAALFERAIVAFDKSRAAAAEAKQAERIAAGNERRKKLLDAQEFE